MTATGIGAPFYQALYGLLYRTIYPLIDDLCTHLLSRHQLERLKDRSDRLRELCVILLAKDPANPLRSQILFLKGITNLLHHYESDHIPTIGRQIQLLPDILLELVLTLRHTSLEETHGRMVGLYAEFYKLYDMHRVKWSAALPEPAMRATAEDFVPF